MEGFEKIKTDFTNGKVNATLLLEIIRFCFTALISLRTKGQATPQQIDQAKKEADQLNPDSQPDPKSNQKFSQEAEDKRQKKAGTFQPKSKKQLKNAAGRKTTADKLAQVLPENIHYCYPKGAPEDQCQLAYTQVVWRIVAGLAVRCGYHVYRYNGQFGVIPNVRGRSEFGFEIVITVAFLVYQSGLSFSQTCQTIAFFQQLDLKKSQLDAILYQLSNQWEPEFETLCALLANSVVVHSDETSWSLKSVWAFLSENVRVIFYGVNKDKKTLKEILNWETFLGTLFSDDAATYNEFTQAQRCWAHLLRKAIQLALSVPENEKYQNFKDALIALYRKAVRLQKDQRYNNEGRAKKVPELEQELFDICTELQTAEKPKKKNEKDLWLLIEELIRIHDDKKLFTFVTTEEPVQPNGETKAVGGTNNESERELRRSAKERDTNQTSKTYKGCRRKSIITSVIGSMRLYLPIFTLGTVLAEINRWWKTGESCFEQLRKKMKLPETKGSILDRVIPESSSG